jgi:oxygen-dependent protoporphyrinogen oxidase
VVAAPATKAAALLGDLAPAAAGELATIDTASVAIVSIAVPTAGVNLPPGSGLLVPAGSPSLVKGVTISSQKWPGAPAGLAFIRASIGRFGDEVVLQRGDDELAARAVADLTLLLGAELHPIDALVTRWGGALPQYDVGHVERVQRIRSAVAAVPGLAVAGASYDGVGIPACVASGRAAAHQALAGLPGLSGPVAPPAAEVGGGGQ